MTTTSTRCTQTGLHWKILERFAAYVASLADGSVHLSGGASRGDEDDFVFVADEARSTDGTHAFCGEVRFVAHYGLLDVPIADPRITVGDGTFRVTIADPEGDRLDFAVGATPPDGDIRHIDLPVTLTADGSEFFFERYPVGFALDPLLIRTSPATKES